MATQVTLNSGSVDSAGSLLLKTNGTTTAVTLDTSQNASFAGAITATTSVTTPFVTSAAATNLLLKSAGTTAVTVDTAQNVGVGVTPPTSTDAGNITIKGGSTLNFSTASGNIASNATFNSGWKYIATAASAKYTQSGAEHQWFTAASGTAGNAISFTQAMTLDASSNLLVGKTSTSITTAGTVMYGSGSLTLTVSNNEILDLNRLSSDGTLQRFYQDNTVEGTISVSGTTVSYNGGHLSRYAQTTTAKDESIVKGTVLSNLNEMNVYTDADGNPVDNEQLNKVKVSDTEGDINVAGVFVSWSNDEDHNVDEINMAMTGDMIIRIAQGTTVQRGDLLMSAGDGTAKPQGDDIVRSKTVAKVTSTHVTCTYADGSYCVPCVLMAC